MSLQITLTPVPILSLAPLGPNGELNDEDEFEGEYWSGNITHNLGRMAHEAGIYEHLWRPEEVGITHANQLIRPLENAFTKLKADPDRYKKHDAENGWGVYKDFVRFVAEVLIACRQHPSSRIEVCR